jgi:hypothetical protein
MFNEQGASYIALMDLFYILVSYIFISLVFRFIIRMVDDQGEVSPFWMVVEKYFMKFHISKIVYLIAAFFLLKANVIIISETLISDMQPIEIFGKINLMLVADVIAIIMAFGSRIALFQKERIEG